MDRATFNEMVRQQFPTVRRMLYVNHAAISPWPVAASEAVAALAREISERGPLGIGNWLQREARLRRTVARMLNAGSGDDIALLKNTSEGIQVVVNGIEWQAGDNVVTASGEFITNRLPWDSLEAAGVSIRRIDIRGSENPEGDLLGAVDRRTRVVAVSSVQWDDGFRLQVDRLGEGLAASDALFFVDAIQQFGALPVDVSASRIDALSAGSHKWQMGPEGMGVFYCHPEWRARLKLAAHGWRMVDSPFRLDLDGQPPSESARRFEAGSPNTLGQAALLASLELLENTGPDEVGRRVLANTGQLIEGLSCMPGVRIISNTGHRRQSGIVSFRSDRVPGETIRSALSRERIFVALRNGSLRLSPHFYQGEAEVNRLLESIGEIVQ